MSLQTTFRRMTVPLLATAAIGLTVLPGAVAQEATMAMPDSVQWGPAPPMLPPGSEVAVVAGDPSQEGLFVLLAKFPPGYEVPSHTHPAIEVLTVISGNLNLSHGEAPSRETAQAMAPGSVVALPADHPHLVWADEETVFQVAGEGPFDIAYLNPEDDPRQETAADN